MLQQNLQLDILIKSMGHVKLMTFKKIIWGGSSLIFTVYFNNINAKNVFNIFLLSILEFASPKTII